MAVKMMGSCIVLILFGFLVEGVFGDTDEEKTATAGHPFILNSGVTKQEHDMVWWYFNDTLIALINGQPSASCLYDGEAGTFRDSLMVDSFTGSLIITHIRPEHAGRYEGLIYRSDSLGISESLGSGSKKKCDRKKNVKKPSNNLFDTIKSLRLTVSDPDLSPSVPDSGLPQGAVAGIVVGVLLVTIAVIVIGVMIYHPRSSRKDMKKNVQGLLEK